ncbi:hypothetical protein NHX12_004343 [Muraenolepis orangiensis]|uniref:Uncharacterized protein n=1 Tax=Muraenolepis orangiensis TaxID=630683 RepID=A0A9Q0DWV2_9TELE|nr:hypothetical protein NHX12_004343 [Muraenolepis orangiensis]
MMRSPVKLKPGQQRSSPSAFRSLYSLLSSAVRGGQAVRQPADVSLGDVFSQYSAERHASLGTVFKDPYVAVS